MRRSKYISE
jgi:sorbitol-specific phosphotransferase system component IIBC